MAIVLWLDTWTEVVIPAFGSFIDFPPQRIDFGIRLPQKGTVIRPQNAARDRSRPMRDAPLEHHTMKKLLLLLLTLFSAHAASKPNLLLIMTDDLGFSDVGCYGSEIATPTLDRLAANGIRMTQMYSTAKCHSSRVSLLTGRWCRQAGDEGMQRAVTIPEVLAPSGYFTAMTGKWHLKQEPTDFGFQRYFGHLSGATNYFRGDKSFRLNGQPWIVPHVGFYTTTANVDHAMRFLSEARAEKKPWFLYIAFNAPHAPLQPMAVDYKKYLGRYEVGWDAIRAARVEKQKSIGLLPADLPVPPRPDHVRAWDQLTPEQRTWEARRMAAYAALIDRVDQELGRLIADLEKADELSNTVILFVSDNGACPYDRSNTHMKKEPNEPDTYWTDSTGWAWARNAPFRFYKQNQFEGGIATPAILHWPAGQKAKAGSINSNPAHLVDVLPTFASLAGATVPEIFPGRALTPLAGISLAPVLAGESIDMRPPIHLLYGSDRGLRDGEWKLVSFQSQPWELYHIATDRAETSNVAAQHPEIVERMAKTWHAMSKDLLKAPADELKPVAIEATEPMHREWTKYDKPLPSHGNAKPKEPKPFTPAADMAGSWAMQVDPKLSNVLILGDSISIGYTRDVRELMKGKANVHRPMSANRKTPANCGDTTIGMANIDAWLGDAKWDVIHFNWGLWDLCYRNPASQEQGNRDKGKGKVSTTPEDYRRNLETLVNKLNATGAKLIWASTTLVPEGEVGRFVGDDAKYNAIAAEIMKKHGIAINDLHATTKTFAPSLFVKPGNVHFTPAGSKLLAEQVAGAIQDGLKK
jgi:arylsulfatase A-like enzyme